MTDPVVHARMTAIIQQEKKLEEEQTKLELEIPIWEKRVQLARSKGMQDLASEAAERVSELKDRVKAIQLEIETLQMDKDMLRYEARRPSGQEVARAELMLEQVRLAGLVDPDRNDHELDSNHAFDFDKDT